MGRTAGFDEMVHHGDKGRTLALQIRRQQRQKMVVRQRAEEVLEATFGMAQVETEIANGVTAYRYARWCRCW